MSTAHQLRTMALELAACVWPEAMSGTDAARAVEELAIAEKALATTRMFLALRVARTDAWRGEGHKSAADWLAAKAGFSVFEAQRQLGTAKKAERLPKTRQQMRKGRLSPNQADAVTDGATADPGAEDDLLGSAESDTNKALRDKAAKAKAAATDAADRERRVRAQRSVHRFTDADGAFHLHLRGPAADGVRLEAMLRPFEEQAFRAARAKSKTSGMRDTFENRAYDAFIAMLGSSGAAADASSLAAVPSAAHPDPGRAAPPPTSGPSTPSGSSPPDRPSESSGPPPRARVPGGNNVKVIVRIDHTALARGHTVAGETCEVAGLGPISVEAVKVLMGDAFLAAVITKGRDVVNVAHLGRGLNAHQRTAIEWAGMRCSNRACNRSIGLQVDHRVPFATDQMTKLDNQDPLCPECHRLKTHHGHHLEVGLGPRRLLPPGHPDNPRTIAANLRPPAPRDTNAQARRSGSPVGDARRPSIEPARRIEQPALC